MRVALIDYDSGNLHSAEKAFQLMGREAEAEIVVTSDPEIAARADRIVLPGDGAFPACRTALGEVDGMAEALREAVLQRGVPFMGICVGMQMLATTGFEYRPTAGLDWIGGEVKAIDAPGLKVPHMGWNDLVIDCPHPVLEGIATAITPISSIAGNFRSPTTNTFWPMSIMVGRSRLWWGATISSAPSSTPRNHRPSGCV